MFCVIGVIFSIVGGGSVMYSCEISSTSSVSRFLSPAADEACQYVTRIVGKNPLLMRELNLSEHELGNPRVNQITALLQDKHCTVNTLK